MCNIAGYAGNRQAAPILLEMLRRQQPYDGDMSTGVAIIHEGKLHYRKIVGDVDTLIRETDVLSLPGTIGIAHTRPGGDKNEVPMHPNISRDGTMALVTNGTTPITKYSEGWSKAADMLDAEGYQFIHQTDAYRKHPYLSRNSHSVSPAEARVYLVEHYMAEGKTIPQAMALACAHMYSDNAAVLISEKHPDSFFALRTTRALVAVMEQGETYMATTRFGLPEDLADRAMDLPLFYACELGRQGIRITADKMNMEPVAEMTPYTYAEAYKRFETLLRSEAAPLHFDKLELAANNMRDLWPGEHTYVQHARLIYDILWQLEHEGRLQREMRIQEHHFGQRHRWYFSLKD